MSLKHLIFFLIFSLGWGTFVSFGLVKPSQVGRRYFIYHGLGVVGLLSAAWIVAGDVFVSHDATRWFCFFLGAVSIFSFTAGLYPWVAWPNYVLATLCGLSVILLNFGGRRYAGNMILSSLMLGFSMAAMLLGHWYLVQPKLSIAELSRVCTVLILVIVVRFWVGTQGFYALLSGKSEVEFYRYLFSQSPGLFVLMRWTWGLLAPLILCYLIWGTVKIRSTQSATGILYVTVLTILTGETLSQYLMLYHGIVL